MNKQTKTCHLCCLLALKCFHRFQSINYVTSRPHANEQNSNAMLSPSLSSFNIWKDNVNNNEDVSPLYDIPLCFHKDFLSDKNILLTEDVQNKSQLFPIKVCVILILFNHFFYILLENIII